jgi:hypothetical protein
MQDYNISSNSLGKISRWYNQQKASGKVVQPWELESAFKGEMDASADEASQSRSLGIKEASLEETKRSNIASEAARLAEIEASKKAAQSKLFGQLGSGALAYSLYR